MYHRRFVALQLKNKFLNGQRRPIYFITVVRHIHATIHGPRLRTHGVEQQGRGTHTHSQATGRQKIYSIPRTGL